MTSFNDLCENKVTPGDFIIYAAADGCSPVLRFGMVLSVGEAKYGKGPSIRVRSVRLRYDGPKRQVDTSLHFPERIMKVRRSDVPVSVVDLLEAA